MEFRHTQGPWKNNGLEIRSKSGFILAHVYKHLAINQTKEEAEANARLIAAAPELLQGLKDVKSALIDSGHKEKSVLLVSIQGLINKATSETK